MNEPKPVDETALRIILDVGERLLAALREEQRISEAYPKDISEVFAYLEAVSRARKAVDECAERYCAVVADYGFPDVPIRHWIEEGEYRHRWNWPPLAT